MCEWGNSGTLGQYLYFAKDIFEGSNRDGVSSFEEPMPAQLAFLPFLLGNPLAVMILLYQVLKYSFSSQYI